MASCWFAYDQPAGRWRIILVFLLTLFGWWVGVYAAVWAYEVNPATSVESFAIAGLVGGATGAAALFAGLALLYQPLRRQAIGWRMLVAGTICGLLLNDSDLSPFLLFPIWQATVTAAALLSTPRASS